MKAGYQKPRPSGRGDVTTHHTIETEMAQRGFGHLRQIRNGQADIRAGWLGYGAVLNEIKARYPGKAGERAFGDAVKVAGLDVWPEGGPNNLLGPVNYPVRTAAMWAAALPPEELAEFEAEHDNTEVTERGGFRGLHAVVRRASALADQQDDQQADDAPEDGEADGGDLGDEDDSDATRKLVARRVASTLSKEFALTHETDTGDIYLTINGVEFYVAVQELDEDGNTIIL